MHCYGTAVSPPDLYIRNDGMKSVYYVALLLWLLILGIGVSHAETLYVTDRILLGIHTEASEGSPLLDSVPSGTAVQVLETADVFKKVRLPNGKTGWASSGYLVSAKPATAQVDEMAVREQKLQAELKTVKEELNKKNREVQVRRDELSNARTTIQELKKKEGNAAPPIDIKMAEELAAANEEIEKLKQKLAQLETSPQSALPVVEQEPQAPQTETTDLSERLTQIEVDNTALRGRIEMALAHLSGEEVPSAEELALLKPTLPNWIWGVLVLMIIIGVIIGVGWMDYRHRQRHGGFRV
jgi:SH3 domain protein